MTWYVYTPCVILDPCRSWHFPLNCMLHNSRWVWGCGSLRTEHKHPNIPIALKAADLCRHALNSLSASVTLPDSAIPTPKLQEVLRKTRELTTQLSPSTQQVLAKACSLQLPIHSFPLPTLSLHSTPLSPSTPSLTPLHHHSTPLHSTPSPFLSAPKDEPLTITRTLPYLGNACTQWLSTHAAQQLWPVSGWWVHMGNIDR